MAKGIVYGMLAGFVLYLLSVHLGLKVNIGGDLLATAVVAASIT